MKISFDGARKNLGIAFNDFANHANALSMPDDAKEALRELRKYVGVMMAIYDPDNKDDDCHDLSDVVELDEIATTN